MGAGAAQTHREVEYKFRVPEDFQLPDFSQGSSEVVAEPERTMSATYFDTTDATLLRWGITMRKRAGGSDDGWHLKIPAFNEGEISGASVRDELHSSDPGEFPPADFISTVAALLRDAELVPLARVETQRLPFTVFKNGEATVEVVDDHVKVFQGETLVDSFREIEVELLSEGSAKLARKIVTELKTLGAQTSSVSKAAAGFGSIAGRQPDVPILPLPKKSALPCDLIRWAITRQVRSVVTTEVTSHATGSAMKLERELGHLSELLQALSVFLEPTENTEILSEISWLRAELTSPAAFDAQHEAAVRAVALVQDPLDRHEARDAIDSHYARRGISAQSSAVAAQRSDRYLYLFSDLMDFARVPPVTDSAYLPQKFWKAIPADSQLFVARVFSPVFPKKTAKLLNKYSGALTPSTDLNHYVDTASALRSVAADPNTDKSAAFALGIALGRA